MKGTLIKPTQPQIHADVQEWLSLAAGVAMMALLGLVIDPDNLLVEPQTLGVMAAIGYIAGFLLARMPVSDLIAHLIASVVGLVAAIVAIDPENTWRNLRSFDVRALASRNWEKAEGFAHAMRSGDRVPEEASTLGLSITIWLVGYAAAWMLFRRGWFGWSLFLPSAIMLTSLALERDQPAWPALAFYGLAVVQAVLVTSRTRTGAWSRNGLRSPRGIARWSTFGGTALALLVVFAGVGAPLSVPDDAQNWVVANSRSLSDDMLDQLDRLPTRDQDNAPAGNYGQFTDEFRIGEGVPSGDTPVALLQAPDPNYLAARKFDFYDGAGWSTTVGVSRGSSATTSLAQAPRISFSANQPMNLNQGVLDSRDERSGVVTLYMPSEGLLMTIETHQMASVPTAMRVGWVAVDESFVIDDVQPSEVPVDLRNLIGMLGLGAFDEASLAIGKPVLSDASLQATVEIERQRLREQYPVNTTLTIDSESRVLLHASGRLPVYEDVEAVFYSGDGLRPESYTVTGLLPAVDTSDLANASTEYPDYVESRYLQLPDTITPRSQALARQIVSEASATTPIAMAVALENHLRTSYGYLIESSLAPDGQDIVDYFLFDRQVGRCDHFASSMVVMLRSLGVPARIVTGLAPVEHDQTAGGFLYRARDAHSWVEAYFPGFGWIPFEPTPSESLIDRSRGEFDQQAEPEATPVPQPQTPEPEPPASATPEATPAAAAVANPGDSGGGIVDQSTSFPGILAPIILALSAVIALLAIIWLWPLRGLRPAASYFFRFQRLATFFGTEPARSLTPAEYARRYGAANPRFLGPAQSVAGAFTDEQYGPPGETQDAALRGLAGWRELRTSVRTWRPWRSRSGG